jgi:hypothetical protein
VHVHPEAPGPAIVFDRARQAERKVRRPFVLHLLAQPAGDQPAEERVDVVGGEGRVGGAGEAAADPEDRGNAGDDQQIARAALGHLDEHLLERIALRHARRGPRCGGPFFVDGRLGVVELAHERLEFRVADQFRHAG